MLFLCCANGESAKAQTKYYHADTSGYHLLPFSGDKDTEHIEFGDTTIIKSYTWLHYYSYEDYSHLISDSTFYRNGVEAHLQRLYLVTPRKVLHYQFTYFNDSVEVERYWDEFIEKYMLTKQQHYQVSTFHPFGQFFENDFWKNGLSVTTSNEGFISDSTYYIMDDIYWEKEFYPDGNIKSHRYKTDSSTVLIEYSKNGKIRERLDHHTKTFFIVMILTSIVLALIG